MIQLTLLQRGVIHRLREAGFTALADMAEDEWSLGRKIAVSSAIVMDEAHRELLADLIRANKHATRSAD